MGSLEQLVIILTSATATCAGARAVTAEALASGAGGCGLPLEPVLDVLPARWASDLCQLACYDLRDEWEIANPLIEEISTGKSACRK